MGFLLLESKRDDLLIPYLEIVRSKGIEISLSQFKVAILGVLAGKGGIKNLSLGSNYYLAGVTKYYFNGDLTFNKDLCIFKDDKMANDQWNEEACRRLDALILILRNSYIDTIGEKFEIEEDFGTLSLPKLLRKYNKKINDALGITDKKDEEEKSEAVEPDRNVGNGYTYEIIYSHEQASKYMNYTAPGSWCITYSNTNQYFNMYQRVHNVHYVFFFKNGFQNVKREKGPGFTRNKPHDEYGNSMIAYLQSNDNWTAPIITSRWNHGSSVDGTAPIEADDAYSVQEFINITGVSEADLQRIYNEWKEGKGKNKTRKVDSETLRKAAEKKEAIRKIKYAQMRLRGGESPLNIFYSIQTIDNSRTLFSEDSSSKEEFLTLFKKGIVKCVLKKEREADVISPNYVFISDRGKLLYETVIAREDYISWKYAKTSESEYASWRDDKKEPYLFGLLIIEIKNAIMIYDTRRKTFVTVDGVSKFKYISYSYWNRDIETPVFYMVALSSGQMAFISTSNNQPLRLPNGQFWFNNFKTIRKRFPGYSNRNLRFPFIYKNDAIIEIVYDPSSEERFFYSIQKRGFINPSVFDAIKSKDDDIVTIDINGSFENYFCVSVPQRSNEKGYFDVNTLENLEIGGLNVFRKVEVVDNSVYDKDKLQYVTEPTENIFIIGLNSECVNILRDRGYDFLEPPLESYSRCILFDKEINSFVTINGKTLMTLSDASPLHDVVRATKYLGWRQERVFFYDNKRKGVVSDGRGNFIFEKNDESYSDFFSVIINGEKTVLNPKLMPIDNSTLKNSQQYSNEMPAYSQNLSEVSEDTIRKIVSEAINNILNNTLL